MTILQTTYLILMGFKNNFIKERVTFPNISKYLQLQVNRSEQKIFLKNDLQVYPRRSYNHHFCISGWVFRHFTHNYIHYKQNPQELQKIIQSSK